MQARAEAPIYLDYAATTPVDPVVAAAMAECLTADGVFGNPASTTHAYGREAQQRVESASGAVAALVGANARDIVLTSGATESNNLAILGVMRANADRGRHLVTARTEHRAVLDPCTALEREGFSVTWLVPGPDGRVVPEQVAEALRPDTQLVSLMHVNNEIGVIQDIAAIARLCRERAVRCHSDAAQSVGKIPCQVAELGVDFLSFTAHKIYGPKGIGALYVAPAARGAIAPILFGGGQQRGLRSGTLATHQVVGFGVAAELAARVRETESQQLGLLRERLLRALDGLPGLHFNGHAQQRVPGIVSISVAGVEGESLVYGLAELALSTGSACSSASREPSYVLRALGHAPTLAESTLRISFGRYTTPAEVDRAGAAIVREVLRLRRATPA